MPQSHHSRVPPPSSGQLLHQAKCQPDFGPHKEYRLAQARHHQYRGNARIVIMSNQENGRPGWLPLAQATHQHGRERISQGGDCACGFVPRKGCLRQAEASNEVGGQDAPLRMEWIQDIMNRGCRRWLPGSLVMDSSALQEQQDEECGKRGFAWLACCGDGRMRCTLLQQYP